MILCCGEALIDMIPMTLPDGDMAYRPLVGGAVFNTAIGLGRLGVPVGMVSGISHDLFGQQLVQALCDSHVATDRLIRADRPTTMAYVTLKDGHATYDFHDENTAGRMIEVADLPALGGDVGALYFGGISLAVEPGAATYAAFLQAEGRDRAVMIDPNIRPGFIRDETVYRDRMARMMAGADIVKLSDDDLAWLYPVRGTDQEAELDAAGIADRAQMILQAGARVVIITRGSAGADAFLSSGAHVQVAAQTAKVVDTVGAGDTFNSGVLASLFQQGALNTSALRDIDPDAMRTALELGARVAAVTVSRAGANPPWAQEL